MKTTLFTAAILIVLSVACLWSFNTLSELFDGPQAQYKHAIAAAALLMMMRWAPKRFYADRANAFFTRGHHHKAEGHVGER